MPFRYFRDFLTAEMQRESFFHRFFFFLVPGEGKDTEEVQRQVRHRLRRSRRRQGPGHRLLREVPQRADQGRGQDGQPIPDERRHHARQDQDHGRESERPRPIEAPAEVPLEALPQEAAASRLPPCDRVVEELVRVEVLSDHRRGRRRCRGVGRDTTAFSENQLLSHALL
jgi:hypothetical protein